MARSLYFFLTLLAAPASACDGMCAFLSLLLVGGPLIPLLGIAFALKRHWRFLNSWSQAYGFILSVPAAIIGCRLSFEALIKSEAVNSGMCLFIGPMVLLCSATMALAPGLLLRIAPQRVKGEYSEPSTIGQILFRAGPCLILLWVAWNLTYYGLGYGAEVSQPVPIRQESMPFDWDDSRLQSSKATISGVGLGMRYEDVVKLVGPPTTAWHDSFEGRQSRLFTDQELELLAIHGLTRFPQVHQIRFGDSDDIGGVEVCFDSNARVNRVWGSRLEYEGQLIGQADLDAAEFPRLKASLPPCDEVRVDDIERQYYYRTLGLQVDVRFRINHLAFHLQSETYQSRDW